MGNSNSIKMYLYLYAMDIAVSQKKTREEPHTHSDTLSMDLTVTGETYANNHLVYEGTPIVIPQNTTIYQISMEKLNKKATYSRSFHCSTDARKEIHDWISNIQVPIFSPALGKNLIDSNIFLHTY